MFQLLVVQNSGKPPFGWYKDNVNNGINYPNQLLHRISEPKIVSWILHFGSLSLSNPDNPELARKLESGSGFLFLYWFSAVPRNNGKIQTKEKFRNIQ